MDVVEMHDYRKISAHVFWREKKIIWIMLGHDISSNNMHIIECSLMRILGKIRVSTIWQKGQNSEM